MLLSKNLGPFLLRLCLVACAFVGIAVAQSPTPTPPVHPEVKRWFDAETLTAATRYRYTDSDNHAITTSLQQYQVVARGRFKFDRKGKYSVVGIMAAGSNIQSGWNLTGWGTGDFQGDFPVKQLYFEAKPVKQVEVQFGGIAPYNGENSEITGYDNDAYLMGERVRIKSPKKLFFDEISATTAFLGDITKPNVFRRFNRLDTWNYYQILVRKVINKRAVFSADYTYEAGVDTLRQGLKLTIPEVKVLDTLRFENYERIDPNAGYGFGLTAEKKATKKLSFIYGMSDINHVMLNGDRYQRGTRLFFHAAYKISPELTVGPVFLQAVGPLDGPTRIRSRVEFIATYNVLDALHRLRVF